MPTYFKPLRRKIGVLTLVMACAFVAWWVRSLMSFDIWGWDLSRFAIYVGSVDHNCITVMRVRAGQEITWAPPLPASHKFQAFEQVSKRFQFRYIFANVRLGLPKEPNESVIALSFPFYLIVISLTLISAWLLLSKSRAKKSTAPTPK